MVAYLDSKKQSHFQNESPFSSEYNLEIHFLLFEFHKNTLEHSWDPLEYALIFLQAFPKSLPAPKNKYKTKPSCLLHLSE